MSKIAQTISLKCCCKSSASKKAEKTELDSASWYYLVKS